MHNADIKVITLLAKQYNITKFIFLAFLLHGFVDYLNNKHFNDTFTVANDEVKIGRFF